MNKLQSILCMDLDGPIINCSDRYYEIYKTNVTGFGGKPISKKEFWESKRSRIDERQLLEMSNVTNRYFPRYQELKLSLIEDEHFLSMDTLQPEVLHVLSFVRNSFKKVLLITLRRNNNSLHKQLEDMGISKYFDAVLSGYDDKIPAWEVKVNLFLNEMTKENTSNPEGYFVGDTETDILAGKKIGLKTVSVLSGIRSRRILETYHPDCIIDDLSNLKSIVKE